MRLSPFCPNPVRRKTRNQKKNKNQQQSTANRRLQVESLRLGNAGLPEKRLKAFQVPDARSAAGCLLQGPMREELRVPLCMCTGGLSTTKHS